MRSRAERKAERAARQEIERRKAEASARFAAAKAEATATGGALGGGWREDGEPVYFVIPSGASEDEAAKIAFRARRGRAMTEQEQGLANLNRSLWSGRPTSGTVALPGAPGTTL